jgi:uncharacterized protein YbjT (DUF2867 family)
MATIDQADMSPILVIGSTGHVGSQIVAQLSDKGVPVRAMTRKPEVARMPAQVELVQGDLTSPEALEPALNGVDTPFLGLDGAASRIPGNSEKDRKASAAQTSIFRHRSRRRIRFFSSRTLPE